MTSSWAGILQSNVTWSRRIEWSLVHKIGFRQIGNTPLFEKFRFEYVNYCIQKHYAWRQNPLFFLVYPTYWGRFTRIWVSKLGHHCFQWWLVACSALSCYQNQCGLLLTGPLGKKRQWNVNQNEIIFTQENWFLNSNCKMTAILSRSRCVKLLGHNGLNSIWTAQITYQRLLLLPWINFNSNTDK